MNHETLETLVTRLERAVLACRRHSLGWLVVGALAGSGMTIVMVTMTGRCG